METVGFEHIHLHTEKGSLLDGLGRVEEYATKWKSHGKYLCITDHGMMSAVPAQIKQCQVNNLTPIIGCELYVNPLQIEYETKAQLKAYIETLDPVQQKKHKKSHHLLAIAYTDLGYQNLVTLSSLAWTGGFYYHPRVNHEQLMKYKEGIIFTSCCYASEIGYAFEHGGEDAGFAMIEKYMAMFGSNFYLELMMLDFAKQKPYDRFLIKAHIKYGLPLEISQDVHFCEAADSKYQRIQLMVQTKETMETLAKKLKDNADVDLFVLQDPNLWMKTEEELNAKWEKDYSDVIDYDLFVQAKRNTVEICKKAGGIKFDWSMKFPVLPNADAILKEAVVAGFKRRNLPCTREHLDRLKEELELITEKSFSSYFLILKSALDEGRRFAREILGSSSAIIGPGRGSGAGSFVCFCLGITGCNPIKHGLLFSRFLSKFRKDYPDLDLDWIKPVRDHLKDDWAPKHFGQDYVCNIGTYGSYGLKSALIDMAKVYGKDRNEILSLTTKLKLKDDEGDVLTWDNAMVIYKDLKAYCDENPEIAEAAKKLVGRHKNMGQHAGGIIISSVPINKFIPLVKNKEGQVVSAWTQGLHDQELEPVGFIKQDWLVISCLEQINYACQIVKKRHGLTGIYALEGQDDFSDDRFIEDAKAIAIANKADLKGIFQFDSDGIRKLVSKGGVSNFDDLAAYTSLWRPGPMEALAHEDYVDRKKGKIYSIHPLLEPILADTYGLICYQEQCMKIFNVVGGISLEDCYTLLKAISKKNEEYFLKYQVIFIENGVKNLGWTKEAVEELFEQLKAFSGYAFNKCLNEETLIPTIKDGITITKKIKDFVSGDIVLCTEGQTEVVALHDNGIQDGYAVIFDDGYEVVCTLDHKFLTDYGQKPLREIIYNNYPIVCKEGYKKVLQVSDVGPSHMYDLEVANSLHNFILPNGVVTSNSHAVAYTYISFMQLCLKANYPLEFYTALLHFEKKEAKIREYRIDAEKHNIQVEPISLNKSKINFDIVDEKIYFGFSNIKGIGEQISKKIVANQPYNDLNEFISKFGTDGTVIKPLIGLRIFGDDPINLYKQYEWMKKTGNKKNNRIKRFNDKCAEKLEKLKSLLPEEWHDLAVFDMESLNKLKDRIADGLTSSDPLVRSFSTGYFDEKDIIHYKFDDVKKLHEAYYKAVIRYKKEPDPNVFDLDAIKLKQDLVDTYSSLELSQKAYYGFLWDHPLEKSPDYTGCTFDSLRDEETIVGAAEVRIEKVEEKVSKKGNTYWLMTVEDANSEVGKVQVWAEDWKRFAEDFLPGTMASIRVKMPDGFPNYTLDSPPKHMRHLLVPANKKDDIRVVLMRKPVV